MRAIATVPEMIISRLRADDSRLIFLLAIEGEEYTSEAINEGTGLKLTLKCSCAQSNDEIEKILSMFGLGRAQLFFPRKPLEREDCISCSIAAILSSFYALKREVNIVNELNAPQELKAILASSLLGGMNIYSIGEKAPALLRYFYPHEALRVAVLYREPKTLEIIAPKSSIYDMIEGLSLIYAGESEAGAKAIIRASNAIYASAQSGDRPSSLPLFPGEGKEYLLLPSSTTCSPYLMKLNAEASDYIKKQGRASISRLSRGATVLIG
ncbi:MAG: hypothetical protein JHC28_03715 [Thermoprotei archaeon]|nr:hypothetical protein [Thermoprotei archaeon]